MHIYTCILMHGLVYSASVMRRSGHVFRGTFRPSENSAVAFIRYWDVWCDGRFRVTSTYLRKQYNQRKSIVCLVIRPPDMSEGLNKCCCTFFTGTSPFGRPCSGRPSNVYITTRSVIVNIWIFHGDISTGADFCFWVLGRTRKKKGLGKGR